MPLRSRAPGSAALQKRLGAADPSRHAECAELCQRRIEEWPCTLGVTRLTAARVHEGLVVVHDRAQRARPLLLEDGAGAGEPVGRLVVASAERAETREREAAVDVGVAEVGLDD